MCPPLRCHNKHFAVFAFSHSCLPVYPLPVHAFSFVSFSPFLWSPHTCIILRLTFFSYFFNTSLMPVATKVCWCPSYLLVYRKKLLELIFHVSFRKKSKLSSSTTLETDWQSYMWLHVIVTDPTQSALLSSRALWTFAVDGVRSVDLETMLHGFQSRQNGKVTLKFVWTDSTDWRSYKYISQS